MPGPHERDDGQSKGAHDVYHVVPSGFDHLNPCAKMSIAHLSVYKFMEHLRPHATILLAKQQRFLTGLPILLMGRSCILSDCPSQKTNGPARRCRDGVAYLDGPPHRPAAAGFFQQSGAFTGNWEVYQNVLF